jgi:hypothetical protein
MMCNVSKTIVLETYSFDTERYDRPLYTQSGRLTFSNLNNLSDKKPKVSWHDVG